MVDRSVLVVVLAGCKVAGGFTTTSSSTAPSTPAPSSGPSADPSRNLRVPDVMFMTRAEAEAAIARSGFERPPSIENNSLCGSTVEKRIVETGRVCYQAPPRGREMGARIPITIRVQTENPYGGDLGGGRRWFLMPTLVGQHVDKARARVKELGFVSKEVQIAESDDPNCKPSIVCKTYPEALNRTDTTSDKVFYVGKSTQPTQPTQPAPPAQPTKPAMGDAF
jgi:beta-lactam-binding protein with PASTA domain